MHNFIDKIVQGNHIIEADNAAKAAGQIWALPDKVRQKHDALHTQLKTRFNAADNATDAYTVAVELKKFARKIAADAYQKLRGYVRGKYTPERAEQMAVELDCDVRLEKDDNDAVDRLNRVQERWVVFDGTPDEIPERIKTPIIDSTIEYKTGVEKVHVSKVLKEQTRHYRDDTYIEYIKLLKQVRTWLVNELPQRVYDPKLREYDFKPREYPSYPIPNDIKGLKGFWDDENKWARLEWKETKDCISYVIYRAEKPENPNVQLNYQILWETENLFFDDTETKEGKSYYYRVRGKNRWHEGNISDAVEILCSIE